MTNNAILRMTTYAVGVVFGALIFGCAGPKVPMTVVHPPSVSEALKLKRIAMGEFEGPKNEASNFSHDVEALLTSIRIQGKPYFEIVSLQATAKSKKTKKRAHVKPAASSVNADGIFHGSIVRSGVTESPYQEQRSQCIRTQTRYNKRGQAIGEVCISWSNYLVGCIKRDAVFEFAPNLVETTTSISIFSETLNGSVSDRGCSDKSRPVEDGASLLAKARQDVLAQIRVALAPVEDHVAAEIIEANGSWFGGEKMGLPDSEQKFAGALEYAKAGRMDRACEVWKEMESTENGYVPLLYDIGLCEESFGNDVNARDYFTRADKLSTKPDKRIAAALIRIEKKIESKQILTKARPDIFYQSKQTRTVYQDQKIYGYTEVNSTAVKIRNFTASPEIVKAGDTLKITMDYSVMAPIGIPVVAVQETMVLKKDGKLLKTLVEEPVNRPPGGQTSEVEFKIPAKMPPGTYVIEQKVQAGQSREVRPAVFVVGS